ncbi:hypothetical protein [Haliscomenobacter hydrossis]|uniref:Lipoprotein n=1 Tax=Haliscomenobacter hydrossis (strain ATCC 27775 / DSM 1100 / LMG 10767 / O) TaxID=760192 RepID=F4L7M7_HALH1|nr:hypothetical protein [Haliscomenobacter hydrossis]AEE54385.1 hypothetical protein Halhy_6569 [Haliscomenobacter hydrossis DSM 1100]
MKISLSILILIPLSVLSCGKKGNPNPVSGYIIEQTIKSSPGADHLVGGIIRAVDCGLGGIAEGIFHEGTNRLIDLETRKRENESYIRNNLDQDDWFIPNWLPGTNDFKLRKARNQNVKLVAMIQKQSVEVDKMKKCWEILRMNSGSGDFNGTDGRSNHKPDTVSIYTGSGRIILFQ